MGSWIRFAGLLGMLWPLAARGQTVDNVYLGCLHSHTSYSDGSGTPEEAYTAARKAGLDFFAITEHNHRRCEDGASADRKDGVMIATDHDLYSGNGGDSLIRTAARMTEDNKFVALYGQEYSSIKPGNHVNVFDVGEVIDDRQVPNGKFDKLVSWLGAHPASNGKPAIVQFNHPFFRPTDHYEWEYGRDDFGGDAEWIRTMGRFARTIEMLNGPGLAKDANGVRPEEVAEKQFIKFLDLGFHVGPTGDQDNHYRTWGTETRARTGIIAASLTKADLYKAIEARHVYATEDEDLKVVITVEGHPCGDVIADPHSLGDELKVRCTIKDGDEPDASYQVDVFSGMVRGPGASGPSPTAVVDTFHLEGNVTDRPLEGLQYTGINQYLFFRITQTLDGEEDADHDRVWTAPVWFEPAAPGGGPTTTDGGPVVSNPSPPAGPGAEPEDVANLVASKRSGSYHVSLECLDARRIKPSNLIRGAAARQNRTLHPGCPRRP